MSLSDVHGYLSAARNALTAVGETDEYPPVVRSDEDGLLHWAGNDYILIVNGDLIDRGDENRACLNLLERLVKEAPDGRVRYHLGNHEMAVLFPERFQWPGVYSIKMNESLRESFIRHVADGSIAVAFEGYRYTYSHAGDNEYFEVGRANRQASEASNQLLTMLQEARYRADQLDILSEYQLVFGVGVEVDLAEVRLRDFCGWISNMFNRMPLHRSLAIHDSKGQHEQGRYCVKMSFDPIWIPQVAKLCSLSTLTKLSP